MIGSAWRWRRFAPGLLIVVLGAAACTSLSSDEPAGSTPATTAPESTDETSPDQTNTDETSTDQGSDPTDTTSADTTSRAEDGTAAATAEPTRLVGDYTVQIISERPHDPTAFTQGLELHDGRLLESTGLFGESERRWVDPQSGDVLTSTPLADEEFGEGITMYEGTVYQLTWKAGRLILADGDELAELGSNSYDGEGWGLCTTDDQFVMSNGSNELTLRSPDTFEIMGVLTILDANQNPITALNELECVGDQVLANIWGLDVIVAIDLSTGAVDAVIDASSLRPANAPSGDLNFALNGIAYDAATGNYLLTGKLWDTLYEVSFVSS